MSARPARIRGSGEDGVREGRASIFVAVAGNTAFAASQMLPKNSVGPKQLKKGAVTATKLARSARQAQVAATGPCGPEGQTRPAGRGGSCGSHPPGQRRLRHVRQRNFQNHQIRSAVPFRGYILPERPLVNVVGPGEPAPVAYPDRPRGAMEGSAKPDP